MWIAETSAEDTAELIAQQKPDIAVAIASGAVPFDWVPIKTAVFCCLYL